MCIVLLGCVTSFALTATLGESLMHCVEILLIQLRRGGHLFIARTIAQGVEVVVRHTGVDPARQPNPGRDVLALVVLQVHRVDPDPVRQVMCEDVPSPAAEAGVVARRVLVLGPLAVLLVVDNALFFVKSTIFSSFFAYVFSTSLLRWRVADLYIFSDGRMEVF